ncbi:DNA-binding protein [Salmonella phage T102]|uniref:DNA-binding protein n=2 Tax=Jerseyvirus TaxID=1910991 RepID=A0AAX3BQN8_9CAUD|nr:putative DNA-binding protein [Salmonella phage fmb-p1]YP_010748291.1 DNA-binding protein [Salmonella phage T102]QWT71876.1 putative DNA-binding protein [Salmonella phage fmb-p1]UUG66253.1 DNA-binding protein [Salmonella phage T102]
MNELMNVSEAQTMSSREIAELTGKEHKNVLADIRKMLSEIQSAEKSADYKDSKGRTYKMLLLDKEETLILISGYSIKMRAAIIRRWQELESQASKPSLPVPKTMGEALRLAADLWEEKERLALENKEMAPKADVYDRIIDRNNLYNATQVAQKFGQSAVWMNKQLEQFGVYNRSVKRGRVFQQWFIDKGYGIMRETETGHSQAMFYAEGEMWIIGKLTEEGLI